MKNGMRWASSSRPASSAVTVTVSPPRASMRISGPSAVGAKTIVPPVLHVPPLPSGASARMAGVPSGRSRRFSLRSAKKPIDLLSGDQKGVEPPPVPGSSRSARVPQGSHPEASACRDGNPLTVGRDRECRIEPQVDGLRNIDVAAHQVNRRWCAGHPRCDPGNRDKRCRDESRRGEMPSPQTWDMFGSIPPRAPPPPT